MSGADSHPKHKIDAFKELRHTAIGSSGDGSTADTSEKFTIVINLGADHVEHFETTITPRPPTIEDKADGDE
jgi:hypothetical protein